MDIRENHIITRKTGQYYTSGPDNASVSCFICHGYGQLAERILRKFSVIPRTRLISAEGLHRFYWKGVTGEVAASWMTSKNRLHEIEDYSHFLSEIYRRESGQGLKVLFGFSQGATTIWRWIHRHKPDFDIFINWAGGIPEDIDLTVLKPYLKSRKLIHISGDQDEYLTAERYAFLSEVIAVNELQMEKVNYSGQHRIDRNVLSRVFSDYVFNK